RDLHRQLANFQKLADAEIKRHGPLAIVPVVGAFGVKAERSLGLGGVRNEGLQKCRVHTSPFHVSGKAPDLICQDSVSPTACLFEDQSSGSGAPFFASQQRIGRAWVKKDRPGGKNPAGDGFFGREEKTLYGIPKA